MVDIKTYAGVQFFLVTTTYRFHTADTQLVQEIVHMYIHRRVESERNTTLNYTCCQQMVFLKRLQILL